MKKLLLALALAAGLLVAAPVASAATYLVVDDDGKGAPFNCNSSASAFTAIQPAVTASSPGGTVQVCPGSYTEQVTVDAAHGGVTLFSIVPLAAVVQAPAAMAPPKAIVHVNGAANARVLGFTITGPGGGGCDSLRYGVRVDAGGSATIGANHIAEIRDDPFSGCQNGVGILVGRAFEATTGSATIFANTIDGYQKNGVTVDNVGSSAQISHNTIRGAGPTATIAQNGIQVSRGATATVTDNRVSDNVYSPQTVSSTGILLFQPGTVTVSDNRVERNDVGIYADTAVGARIAENELSGHSFDGISLLGPTTGALVERNHSFDNLGDGIFADVTATGNTLRGNTMSGNAHHDCHDDSVGAGTAGTANSWLDDVGETENRPGLCESASDDDHHHHEDGDHHGDADH